MNNSSVGLFLPALHQLNNIYSYYIIDDSDSDSDNYYFDYPQKSIRFQYYHLGRPIEEILAQDRKMNKILNKAMKKSKINKNFKNLR